MCNGERDHKALGKVTLGIVEIVKGKIAFCDTLARYTNDPEILNDPGVVEFDSESIISTQLFSRWLEHTDFGMVK